MSPGRANEATPIDPTLVGTCHCGGISITLPRAPRTVTECNCSVCRRYATLWGYYTAGTLRIDARAPTQAYAWNRHALEFVRCAHCGCVTHWQNLPHRETARTGVNLRNFDPSLFANARLLHLDGADSWRYSD